MPSAATKPDTKPQLEGESAIKQALTVLDKKVRNLEKRKTKLDSYRAKKPDDLNDDQREAIGHYEEVIVNLEFARDMQKQFIQINTDADKVLKKQAKRDKIEKLSAECRRMKEILQLQNVLDNMGTPEVREDFKEGKNGALQLTEENLTQLDEWYPLISPSREGETAFAAQCDTASDHLVAFLEGKEKEVVGTTYAALRSLIQQITDCGYFDNMPDHTDETAEEEAPVEEAEEEQTYTTPPTTETEEPETEEPEAQPTTEATPEPSPEQTTTQQPTQEVYTQPPATEPEARPTRNIAEIVSTGSFNFLQDSQIDDSPHADPAVVAAHPMAPGMVHSSDLQFTNAGLPSEQSQTSFDPQQTQPMVVPQAMGDAYNTTFTSQTFIAQSSTYAAKTDMPADVPPPIPYPNETQLTSQSYVSVVEGQMAAEQTQNDMEKPFHGLNPNAPTFYSDQSSPRENEGENKAQFADQQTDSQGGAPSNNYQGRQGGQRGGRGSRGVNGSSNYRGGSRSNFGERGRGNYGGSNYRGGYRGGFQNEGGYQGYGGNNYRGGFKRGGPREGNNGGSGSRGGAPRGGGRGGNRGNYGNRNNGYSSNQPVSA